MHDSIRRLLTDVQDDLAERTLPSPCWVSYDPDIIYQLWDDDGDFSDDDFYEGGTIIDYSAAKSEPRKRPAPSLSLGPAIPKENILWRSTRERLVSPELPSYKGEGNTKVTLLQDWRQDQKAKTVVVDLALRQTDGHEPTLLKQEAADSASLQPSSGSPSVAPLIPYAVSELSEDLSRPSKKRKPSNDDNSHRRSRRKRQPARD